MRRVNAALHYASPRNDATAESIRSPDGRRFARGEARDYAEVPRLLGRTLGLVRVLLRRAFEHFELEQRLPLDHLLRKTPFDYDIRTLGRQRIQDLFAVHL